jgi:hypothetical protein
VSGQTLVELAGDTLALAVALLGWVLHVRTCRDNMNALRDENARLIELLGRLAEQRR